MADSSSENVVPENGLVRDKETGNLINMGRIIKDVQLSGTAPPNAIHALKEFTYLFLYKQSATDARRHKCIEDMNSLMRHYIYVKTLCDNNTIITHICDMVKSTKQSKIINYIPAGGESLLQVAFKNNRVAALLFMDAGANISAATLPVLADPDITFQDPPFKIWDLIDVPLLPWSMARYGAVAMINSGIFEWTRPIYGTLQECWMHVIDNHEEYSTEYLLALMQALVSQGADVNEMCALEIMCDEETPSWEIINFLIQNGARITAEAYANVCNRLDQASDDDEDAIADRECNLEAVKMVKQAALEQGWQAIKHRIADEDFHGSRWLKDPHFNFVVQELQTWCKDRHFGIEKVAILTFVRGKFHEMRIEHSKYQHLEGHADSDIVRFALNRISGVQIPLQKRPPEPPAHRRKKLTNLRL
jgi:hypothetical protein